MPNLYYNPEAFGLTVVDSIDFSDGCYQFDTLVVWRDAEGRFYYAEDAGCSCPAPFEDLDMPDLTRVQDPMEIVSRMEYRAESAYDSTSAKAEVADFKAKVLRGEFRVEN